MALWLVALAIASAVATEDASTAPAVDPLKAAQQEYDSADEKARALAADLEAKVKSWRDSSKNETSIKAFGDKILKDTGHTTPTRTDIQHLRDMEREQHKKMRTLRHDAHSAFRAVKHWARLVEKYSRRAGLSEHVYEGNFEKQEEYSEGRADHMENVGDEGCDHIERAYSRVERYFEKEKREADEKARAAERQEAKEKREAEEKARAAERQEAKEKREADEKARAAERKKDKAEAADSATAGPSFQAALANIGAQSTGPAALIPTGLAQSVAHMKATRSGAILFACVLFASFVGVVGVHFRRPTQDAGSYLLLA